MDGDVVSVERVIPAGPAAIFALVADASRHPEIDGSGTVKQVKPGAPQMLSLGATFGMSMKVGVKYSMVSHRHRVRGGPPHRLAEPPRRIRREVRGRPDLALRARAGRGRDPGPRELGHQPGPPAGAPARSGGLPEKTAANMAKTLERIEEIVTDAGRDRPPAPCRGSNVGSARC